MMHRAPTQSLRIQFFWRLTLILLILIPLFGVYRYYVTRDSLDASTRLQRHGVAATLSVALKEPVWNINLSQVDEVIRSQEYLVDLQGVILDSHYFDSSRLVFLRSDHVHLDPAAANAPLPAQLVVVRFVIERKGKELAQGRLLFSNAGYWQALSDSVLRIVAQLALFGLAMLLSIYWLMLHHVGRPLRQLMQVLDADDVGGLHTVATALDDNEIKALAERYLDVLSELTEHQVHLQELVAARTRALADANQQLTQEVVRREHTEVRLIQARQQAEQANTAKTQFLSNMSHELRTPLNGIIGYTELLHVERLTNPRHADYITKILACASHLLELINRVLDLSKVEQGRMEREDEPFHLNTLVADVHSMVVGRAEGKGLQLELELEEQLPDPVLGDRGKIKQILINLLGNAIKFTKAGHIRLGIHRGTANYIEFTVSDTGSGIPAADLARIFEPFQQSEAVLHVTQAGGTGLGLAICKTMAELMDGRLEVESELGKGSTFRLAIPLPPVNQPLAVPTEAAVPTIRRLKAGQYVRILVVDDVDYNRDFLEIALSRAGFAVDIASGGQEALDLAKDTTYDLVIMDIAMPGMDGITASRALHAKRPQLPVLAYTANIFNPSIEIDIQTHFNGVMRKPLDIQTALRTLAEYLPIEYDYDAVAAAAEPAVPPSAVDLNQVLSAAELATLREGVSNGNLRAIRDQAQALQHEAAPSRRQAGDLLYQLAAAYDIGGLQALLATTDPASA